MIYNKTQGHNCDTENKPVIGRMQALSSTDKIGVYFGDINLTFHFGYGWKNIWLPWIHIMEHWSHPTSYRGH